MNNKSFNSSNNDNDGSSRHFGKSKEQSQERIRGLEELIKKIAAEAKAKEVEHESRFCNDMFDMLHGINFQKGDEDCFSDKQKSSNDLWQFFKWILDCFGTHTGEGDFKTYCMMREKKERGGILSMLNYIGRIIKALALKVLGYDVNLSWEKQLEKEIKELSKKIENGEMVGEALIGAMRRLELLRDIKFKFQMFAIGWFSDIFAGFILDELLTSTSLSQEQEEGKQVEKEALKEKEVATKKIKRNVENGVKVDAREKPQSMLDVNPMRNIQPIKIIVPLATKEELNTLPKPSINLFFHVQEQTVSNRNSGVPKQEEQKNEVKKQVKPAKPKKEAPPVVQPKVRTEQEGWFKVDNDTSKKMSLDNAKKPRRGTNKGLSSQPPTKTNENFHTSAENEPQQSSVNNAPRSEFTDVLEEHVEGQSVGKEPGR